MCKNSLVGEKGWFVAEWPRLFLCMSNEPPLRTSSTVNVVCCWKCTIVVSADGGDKGKRQLLKIGVPIDSRLLTLTIR